jgi:hypothetical protein
MWLKRWLSPKDNRPKWAWAANAIIESCKQSQPQVPTTAVTEWVEQRWNMKIHSSNLSEPIRQMLKAAKKYNIKISIIRAPLALKLAMPAFLHPGSKNNNHNNTQKAECIRKHHSVRTIGASGNLQYLHSLL